MRGRVVKEPPAGFKVVDYLDAGTQLVWVVEPRSRSVTIYRSLEEIRLLTGDDEIDAGTVLPGLRLKVSRIFQD